MKSIKTIRSLVLLAMLAAGVTACSKENNDTTTTPWNGEIRLGSEMTSQVKTRAAADVPDRQIADGKIVTFFIDDAGTNGTAKMLYENYLVKADGNGGFSKSDPADEELYYPATGNRVDIYALLTDGFSGKAFPNSAITHSVATDQSEQYGAHYLASDLLYAAKKGVARSKQPVRMNFYHLLAKVEVALKAGVGAPDLKGAVVTIENTRLKADFLPLKAANINDPTGGQADRAAMLTLTADNNPMTPVKIGTSIETAAFSPATAYASAVLVPQTVAKNSRFIKVTLASGGELYYTIPEANDLVLKSGNNYQFQITVNLKGLTVQSTIADWATGTPSGGTAEMPPPPLGSKDPAKAAVGDFYFSDGTLEDKDARLTPAQQAACIGIVYWLGDMTADDPLLKTKHPGCTHGLVVAVQDATANEMEWSVATETVNNWTNAPERGGGKVDITVLDKRQGYANTLALTAYNAQQKTDNLKVLPIAAIARYATTHPAPQSSSGWYSPSVLELKEMCWGQGNTQSTSGRDLLNTQFGKLSGAKLLQSSGYDFYWSSSESTGNGTDAWAVGFNNGEVAYGTKNFIGYVRGILAF
ncbi:MAG: fimbrillin family protein [Odoribacter sp.]